MPADDDHGEALGDGEPVYEGIIRDVTELLRQQEELTFLASHDPLTGLLTRSALNVVLTLGIARAMRNLERLAVFHLDLDKRELVNAVHGHAVGDRVLQEVAARLREPLRASDTVARLGGDASRFLQRADAAMYNVKTRGRNGWKRHESRAYDPSRSWARGRIRRGTGKGLRSSVCGGCSASLLKQEGSMKRSVSVLVLVVVVGLCASLGSLGETIGFGFGGGGAMAFFPDLAGIDAFLSENGLDPLEGGFLIGGGGGGRGGAIGGMAFGGMGFGVVAESEGIDRSAELVVGAGGFDVGFAVGGSERSVLTLGVVLGGGAAVLDLSFWDVIPTQGGRGVVPVPVETREIVRAFGFILPYVSMEAQVLGFMGLEVRIGYLLPVVGVDLGDGAGIPAPSLDLSGPFLGFSLVFGGIGDGGATGGAEKTATSGGSIDLGSATNLSLENGAGTIRITSYAVEPSQTASARAVEWEAVRRAPRPQSLSGLQVDVGQTATGVSMRTVGIGDVDYALRVPAGTSLNVVSGAGRIEIMSYAGANVSVSLGAGEIVLDDIQAASLSVTAGVGSLSLSRPHVSELTARIGMGEIQLVVLPDVSATIAASVGLGELTIAGFPDVAAAPQGVVRRTLRAVLGAGTAQVTLSAGMGQIGIVSVAP